MNTDWTDYTDYNNGMLELIECPGCGEEFYFELDSLPGGDEHCEYCEICCGRLNIHEQQEAQA